MRIPAEVNLAALAQAIREVPAVANLALPIVLGLAASTLLGVTDSVIVAQLGPAPLAVVGLTSAAALIGYSAIYGLLSALSVRIGLAQGARQGRRIASVLRNGLALAAGVGAASAALMGAGFFLLPLLGQPPEVLALAGPYWAAVSVVMLPYAVLTAFKFAFEATGRPWLGTFFAFLGVVLNVPLTYVLTFGPGPLPALGLLGAGLASLLAESLALVAAWAWWRRARSLRRLRLRRPLQSREIRDTFREGAPLGLLYVTETVAMAAAVALIGTFGTTALAANQVTQSVGGLLYMLPLGIAGAVAIRVAQEKGAGRVAALRPVGFAAIGLALAWLLASALLLLLGGDWIARLITPDPEVAALAATLFVVLAGLQIADGLQSTALGALRGLSDTAWPAWVTLGTHWLLALPLAWAFSTALGWGPAGVWSGYGIALGCAGIALVARFLWRTRPDGLAEERLSAA